MTWLHTLTSRVFKSSTDLQTLHHLSISELFCYYRLSSMFSPWGVSVETTWLSHPLNRSVKMTLIQRESSPFFKISYLPNEHQIDKLCLQMGMRPSADHRSSSLGPDLGHQLNHAHTMHLLSKLITRCCFGGTPFRWPSVTMLLAASLSDFTCSFSSIHHTKSIQSFPQSQAQGNL